MGNTSRWATPPDAGLWFWSFDQDPRTLYFSSLGIMIEAMRSVSLGIVLIFSTSPFLRTCMALEFVPSSLSFTSGLNQETQSITLTPANRSDDQGCIVRWWLPPWIVFNNDDYNTSRVCLPRDPGTGLLQDITFPVSVNIFTVAAGTYTDEMKFEIWGGRRFGS